MPITQTFHANWAWILTIIVRTHTHTLRGREIATLFAYEFVDLMANVSLFFSSEILWSFTWETCARGFLCLLFHLNCTIYSPVAIISNFLIASNALVVRIYYLNANNNSDKIKEKYRRFFWYAIKMTEKKNRVLKLLNYKLYKCNRLLGTLWAISVLEEKVPLKIDDNL